MAETRLGEPIPDPGLESGAAETPPRFSFPLVVPLGMSRRTVFVLILAAVLPGSAAAQLSAFGGPIAQSDMAYMAGDPALSYSILEAQLAADSTDYELLWRAARAAVVIGIEQEESRDQNHWLDPALRLSERAVIARPDGIDGIYWRGVSAGRRAMNASPSYAVGLAEAVYTDAHAILAADSLHGGAHNMLGKLNYEIMSLSWFERTVAKTFMGNDALDDTSWENAEYHLQRAVDAWPDFILFHFDMGQLHRKRDRQDQAIESFRQALTLRAVHPIDRRLQDQAREILIEWGVPEVELTSGTSRDR